MTWVACATWGGLVMTGCQRPEPETTPCYAWNVAFLDGSVPVSGSAALLAKGEWQGGWTGVGPDELIEQVAVEDGVITWPEAPAVEALTLHAVHPSGVTVHLDRTPVFGCGTHDLALPTPTVLTFQRAATDRVDARWYGKIRTAPEPPDMTHWLDGSPPDVFIDQAASTFGVPATASFVFPVNQAQWEVHVQWFRWTLADGLRPSHLQTVTVPVESAGGTYFVTF